MGIKTSQKTGTRFNGFRERFTGFFHRHYGYIIIILFVLLFIKSCQSCTNKNATGYVEQTSKIELAQKDSIINVRDSIILNLNNQINLIKIELDGCKVENNNLKQYIIELKNDKKELQKNNSTLIKQSNEFIINKNTNIEK